MIAAYDASKVDLNAMGISIDVESILTNLVTPRIARTSVSTYRNSQEQAYLHSICQLFNWEIPPWQEPSEIRGLNTCLGNGRNSLLLSLAWALEEDTAGDSFDFVSVYAPAILCDFF